MHFKKKEWIDINYNLNIYLDDMKKNYIKELMYRNNGDFIFETPYGLFSMH